MEYLLEAFHWNYGITTCPRVEWDIIVNGNLNAADMRADRRVPDIENLLSLEQATSAKLQREEVIAVVLYTGPMFELYNCALRQRPVSLYEKLKEAPSTTSVPADCLTKALSLQQVERARDYMFGTKT